MILYVDDEAGVLFLGAAISFFETLEQSPIITIGISQDTGIMREIDSTVGLDQWLVWNGQLVFEVDVSVGDGFPESIDQMPVSTFRMDRVPKILQMTDQTTGVMKTIDVPTSVQNAIMVQSCVTMVIHQTGVIDFSIDGEPVLVQERDRQVPVTQEIDKEVQLD